MSAAVVDVHARALAAARAHVDPSQIAPAILRLLGEVYAFLKSAPVRQTGQNIVVYATTPEGLSIEAGVEVSGPFESGGTVYSTSTPAGRAAHAVHVGEYAGLPSTHAALRTWCVSNGHSIAGPNWEIYGDWNHDPDKLATEVFYLLR